MAAMEYVIVGMSVFSVLGACVFVWSILASRKDKSCLNCAFRRSAGIYGDVDDHCERLNRPCGAGCKGVYFMR